MNKEKMLKVLGDLVSECCWAGTKDRLTKNSETIVKRRLNQLSRAIGHDTLSEEELQKIVYYLA